MAEDAAPTNVEASAPAVEAPTEAVSEPAVESSSEPAVESSSESSTTSSSHPAANDFGWDDWDGEHTGLPETVSPWAEKVLAHHQTRFDSALAEKDRDYEVISKLYNDYLLTGEDPRVAELTTSNSEWEKKFEDLNSKYGTYKAGIEAQ